MSEAWWMDEATRPLEGFDRAEERPFRLYDWGGMLDREGEPHPWAYSSRRADHYQILQSQQRYINAAIRQLVHAAIGELVRSAVNLLVESVAGLEEVLVMDDLYRMFSERLNSTLRSVADDVQNSIKASYASQVTAREKPSGSGSHYRAGHGRLPYTLRRAIADPSFVTVSSDHSMSIGNVAVLEREAKHWHRIAFGAGQAGGGGTDASFPMTIGSEQGMLSMHEEPSPGFMMPPGRWIGSSNSNIEGFGNVVHLRGEVGFSAGRRQKSRGNPTGASRRRNGSGDQFYPGVENWQGPRWIRTKGIVGKNFFAAGLARLSKELPKQLDDLWIECVREWAKSHGHDENKVIEGRLFLKPI